VIGQDYRQQRQIGATRIVGTEDVFGDLIETIDDVIYLDEGENQYDLRPGFWELGCSKTGLTVSWDTEDSWDVDFLDYHRPRAVKYVEFQICEASPAGFMAECRDLDTIVSLFQKPDGGIEAWVFHKVRLVPIEIPYNNYPRKGEASSFPAKFRFTHGIAFDRRRDSFE